MGGYPPHGTGTRGLTVPGGAVTEWEAPVMAVRHEVGVHLSRGSENKYGV